LETIVAILGYSQGKVSPKLPFLFEQVTLKVFIQAFANPMLSVQIKAQNWVLSQLDRHFKEERYLSLYQY